MDEDQTQAQGDDKSDGQDKHVPFEPSDPGGVRRKSENRRAALLEAGAVLSGVLAGYLVSDAHYSLSVVFLTIVFVTMGCAIAIRWKQQGGKHHQARQLGRAIIMIGFAVIAGLVILDISKTPFAKTTDRSTARGGVPRIDLTAGAPLDEKDPFGTVFTISNQGTCPVSNIWAIANFRTADAPLLVHFVSALNPIPELKPGRRAGLHFAGYRKPLPFDSRTWVTVEIRFTTEFSARETNTTFQFCVSKDASDNYRWIDSGEGQDMVHVLATKIQPTRAVQVVPVLDIRIMDVTDASNLDRTHPLRIEYSWRNGGGMAATGVYLEWAAFDPRIALLVAWSNQWSKAVLNEVLMPGFTNSMRTVYRDDHHPEIFTNILCGNCTLIGMARFKDLENHDYEEHFRAVRTNNAFEVRYFDFGGHFRELGLFQHPP